MAVVMAAVHQWSCAPCREELVLRSGIPQVGLPVGANRFKAVTSVVKCTTERFLRMFRARARLFGETCHKRTFSPNSPFFFRRLRSKTMERNRNGYIRKRVRLTRRELLGVAAAGGLLVTDG